MGFIVRLFIFALLFGASTTNSYGSSNFQLHLSLAMDGHINQGRVELFVQYGSERHASIRPFERRPSQIRKGQTIFYIQLLKQTIPTNMEYLYVWGRVFGQNDELIGVIPLNIFDRYYNNRGSYSDHSLIIIQNNTDIAFAGFPFTPSIERNIDSYPFESILAGLSIILRGGLISGNEEWERFRDYYFIYIENYLLQDSSQTDNVMNFLNDYVRTVEDERYNIFYVDFLLHLKQARIGGIITGGRTLDELIFDALEDMFTQQIGSTLSRGPIAIQTYRIESSFARSHECLSMSSLLINAVDNAITNGEISLIVGDDRHSATLSLLQAATECAQYHFVASDNIDASRRDVSAASQFLRGYQEGEQFLMRYTALFDTLQRLDLIAPANHFSLDDITEYYNLFSQ